MYWQKKNEMESYLTVSSLIFFQNYNKIRAFWYFVKIGELKLFFIIIGKGLPDVHNHEFEQNWSEQGVLVIEC